MEAVDVVVVVGVGRLVGVIIVMVSLCLFFLSWV